MRATAHARDDGARPAVGRSAALRTRLREAKALVRHWTRSAALMVSPSVRYAQVRADQPDWGSTAVDVRTPIKRRDGPSEIDGNRIHNMELASSHLDGLVIGPGEVFRFWREVPRATRRNGYRTGYSVVHGRLELDYGGGLCQVATTLFQAFLACDCEVLDRSNHSVDAHGDERFAPLGRDAAVAFGYKDLMVRNTTGSTLRVRAEVDRAAREYRVRLDARGPQTPSTRIRTVPVAADRGSPVLQGILRVRTVRESVREGVWVETYESVDSYRCP